MLLGVSVVHSFLFLGSIQWYECINLLKYLLIERFAGFVEFGAITNEAAMNNHVQDFV